MPIRNHVIAAVFLMVLAVSSGLSGQEKGIIDEGIRHFEEENLPEARACFEKALAEESDVPVALYYLGRISLMQKDADDAIDFLEKAVKEDETNSDYHNWLGLAYVEKLMTVSFFEKGILSGKALEHFRKAVKLDPQNVDARISLAQYYVTAPSIAGGSKQKAEEQIDTIMKYSPADGHFLKADIHAKEKEYGLAEEELKKCIEAQPEKTECYYTLGMIYRESERYTDAFEAFERVIETDPDDPDALYQIGKTAAVSGKNLERGIECLLSYLGRDAAPGTPGHDGAYWRLGMIYEKQGNIEKARKSYERAIELNPNEKRYRKSIDALDND